MTGAELVPAISAAAGVAKKAVDDTDDKAALQALAANSPNMKAAAESYARRIAVKEAVLLKIYQPIARFLGASREYFDTDFHSDLAAKVNSIPDEQLTTPSPSIAIPAMLGLGYAFNEPELKEMYLSLLATATDARVSDKAHPSFAEVIKQLSPREASLLLSTLRRGVLPVVRLQRLAASGEGCTIALSYMAPLERDGHPVEEPALPIWLDNWARLGLVEVDYGSYLVAPGRYDWAQSRPEFVRISDQDSRGEAGVGVMKGLMRATDFGQHFLAAVSYDGVSLDGAPGEPG